MGKYKPYAEYSDTGIDWLGNIPSHWEVKRFKFLFQASTEKNGNEVVGEMLSVSGYRGIEIKQYEDESHKRTEEELTEYRVVRPGQLVVNTMWLNYAGLGVSEYEGHVSPAYRSYWIDSTLQGRFAHHLLRSCNYVTGYTKYMQGIRPNSLQIKTDDFLSFPVLVPPKSEQLHIAAFLDHETAKIDRLIATQERLIELLKEKRQAVISHAVTKGLNPDAPMKGSGVEWLGEVPAHWPVIKLGYFAKVLNGSTPDRNNAEYWQDGDVPWLSSSAINAYNVTTPSEFITKKALAECSVELIPKDSVLVGLVGQGKTRGLSALLTIGATINQNVAAIIPRKEQLSSRFLHLFLQSIYKPLRDFGRGGNQAALNNELVAALRMALPSKDEQDAIVEHIEKQLNVFHVLTHKVQNSIDLMYEHRNALISAAVTGKIDVRGWKNPIREIEDAKTTTAQGEKWKRPKNTSFSKPSSMI